MTPIEVPAHGGRRGKQSGYLLLPVAVAIALIGVIAFLTSSESAIETNMAAREFETARAEYVAQAGLQHALRELAQQGCGPYTDLTNVAFGNDQYDTRLTHDLGGTATYTVDVDQDTWIRDDFPTNNYANDTRMHIRNEGGVIERPLLRYDLSKVPAKAAILSARAWFYVNKEHSEGPVDIHLITTDWTDTDATWDSMGDKIDSQVLASIPTEAGSGVWVSVNLTSQVQAWVNGETNHGITINTNSAGVHSEYLTSESAFAPYIEVLVGTPPTSPSKLKSTSKIDGGGAATVERADVYLYQSPASHVQLRLSDGTGQDALLDSFYNSRNYGNHEIEVETIGSDENSLIRFDLPAIPPGARVISARLELYHYLTESTQVNPGVEIYRVTRDWVEGTKDGSGTADGATWRTWDGSNNWTQNGGDHDVSPVASSDISPAINDWESWEIGELVQGWIDGTYPNYGLLLKGTGSIEVRFASKEDADPALRPRLSISYSCTCGEVCLTPQGSGKIALIGDDASPDPDDQVKIAIIESWGYDVDFYEDRDADTINWSNYDLAYVSETTRSGDFSGDPAIIPIGVVNEEPNLYDEFLLASSESEHVGDTIDIVDNSHYITAVFPQGDLPIYTGAMEILSANTPLAPDLQILGEFGGAASLTAIDQGAAASGGTAAARRVTLPLGQHFAADFDWSRLNSNGYLLVQRSIEWAMAKAAAGTTPLLMVVTNPGSLTADESAKKALIESWGYAVNLIDDNDSLANFYTAYGVNDVIYVSGEVSDSAVSSKLIKAPIGVVNEQIALHDEMLLSSSAATNDFNNILVIDNSHYITDGINTGWHTIASSNQPLNALTGTLAPGLTNLAEVWISGANYDFGLAVIDTGGQLNTGEITPSRRVQLPWGTASFNFGTLNDNGKNLMRKAIEWAGGANFDMTPYAHWKLDETTGPTAVDSESGHDGTLANDPAWAPGLLDGGLKFDGANDTVAVGSDESLDDLFSTGATISGWIYAEGWGGGNFGRIADKADALGTNRNGWAFELYGANRAVLFQFGFSGDIGNWYTPVDSISLGQWHHVAVTYDNSSAANDPTIYIDGVAQTLIELDTPSGIASSDAASDLHLGNYAIDLSRAFDGTLDDIRIFDRMLSASEIEQLAQLPGPLAHWKLDETTGQTALDSEGGHDGTLTNDPAWGAGAIDGALEFDGGDDYVDVPHDDNLSLTSFSIQAVIKPTSLSGWQVIVNKGTTTSAVNYYLATNGDEIGLGFYNAGWVEFNTSNVNLAANEWYHVVATYNDYNREGRIYLNGVLVHNSTVGKSPLPNGDNLTIGRSGFGEYWPGTLDDVRIYNRVLTDSEVSDLFNDITLPGAATYTELYEPWDATADDTWQTVDLSGFGVPAGAVVEVAIYNDAGGNERWGGVREVGSTLERRVLLHEAEQGGTDLVTMHAQANTSSQIQHYSDNDGDVRFVLLGYWTGAAYTELFEPFTAADSNSWEEEALSAVGANRTAEIVMQNTNAGAERLAGVREIDSSWQRRFNLQEAERGGVDAATLMVNTDEDGEIEVYAQNSGDVDFYVIGYWSTPPGTYTENGTGLWNPSSSNWETVNLSAAGVPAGAVVNVMMTNLNGDAERWMGLRAVGSSANRRLDLHEPEDGGADLASIHVQADASSNIQSYSEASGALTRFAPVGWWVLSP